MRIGSLFAGVGGLELGLEWSGVGHTVWQVEQDEYCRRVLARHWPDAERFDDVRTVGADNLSPIDVLCGGFPCQDVSRSGKRAGIRAERSGLWSEFSRIIRELRPRFVVVENVAGLLDGGIGVVLGDLAELGFDAEWHSLSACAVGAPHMRRRVFVLAYPKGIYGTLRLGSREAWKRSVSGKRHCEVRSDWMDTVANNAGGSDGIRNRVDRLRALGNAVVPQCAEVIGWIIRELQRDLECQ